MLKCKVVSGAKEGKNAIIVGYVYDAKNDRSLAIILIGKYLYEYNIYYLEITEEIKN